MKNLNYDIIVIGAGHAGIEAALAGAKVKLNVGIINLSATKVATMPCNPSIGGPAKGIIVREIDALGGIMGRAADANYLQMKLLNTSKGPAVQALRAQIDKINYSKFIIDEIKKYPNITFIKSIVDSLIIEDGSVKGVLLNDQQKIFSKSVILTTGTYASPLIMRGEERKSQGPNGEKFKSNISKQLKEVGFDLIRLKTGTPPRIRKSSIDFTNSQIAEEPGSEGKFSFSFVTKKFVPLKNQAMCWLMHSTELTREIVIKNLKKSIMYNDRKNGQGPRYCPSFEDKIVKFADKNKHQIFLEPESDHLNTIYVQGFSTSMPRDVQLDMIHSLPGMDKAIVERWGFAIEYDAIKSIQLKNTLETKIIKNLYTAGQINGTSGYEEAACQGLIAGINAGLKIMNKSPFILKRSEAYIGVLIDDIVTKVLDEPYRMLTSRAEYRLLLRNDNAEERLKAKGHSLGLISDSEWALFNKHQEHINLAIENLNQTVIKKNSAFAKSLISKTLLKENISAFNLLKRPEIKLNDLETLIPTLNNLTIFEKQNLVINIKFLGYVRKQKNDVKKFIKLERKLIPLDIDYDSIPNIATEARQKLKLIKPTSVGQATRILGINPSDIQMILFYLKKKYNFKNK